MKNIYKDRVLWCKAIFILEYRDGKAKASMIISFMSVFRL